MCHCTEWENANFGIGVKCQNNKEEDVRDLCLLFIECLIIFSRSYGV